MKYIVKSFIISIPLILISTFGYSQFKKIPTLRDTLDFPNDFRNKTGIPIGNEISSFTYRDIEGDTISSNNFNDTLIVYNFWFVGCVGCKQEEPYLTRLTKELEGEKIKFISICNSSESRIKRYMKKNEDFGYKIISINSKKDLKEKFGVLSFPTHFLVMNGEVLENFSFPLTTDDEIGWFKNEILKYLKR